MLPTNYRCAPRVLDAARALIEGSLVRAQKPPLLAAAVAMGHGGGELRTVAFPDRATELDALGGELQRLQRQQPGRLSGVAVLCRLRAQVDEVSAGAPHPYRTPYVYFASCASRLKCPRYTLCTPHPAPRSPAPRTLRLCAPRTPHPHPVPCAPAPRRYARASASMVCASPCTDRATRRASSK